MTAPTRAPAIPLTRFEVERLARYNSEHARGIVHSDTWAQAMWVLQDRHHRAMADEWHAQIASENRPRRRWWWRW